MDVSIFFWYLFQQSVEHFYRFIYGYILNSLISSSISPCLTFGIIIILLFTD